VLFALFLTSVLVSADGLQQRVEFWKAVFTEYGEDHLIFHDRHHVHLIYDVFDLNAAGADRRDRNTQQQIELRQRERVAESLNELSGKTQAQWSDFTRQLARKIEQSGIRDTPAVLADRIHIQRGVREKFSDGLKRYSNFAGSVERILREEGISEDFAALPLVESAYVNAALSRAGAAGIWQFMPSTARQYMKVTATVDQRLDPAIATRSAARLLLKNYSVLKNWPLAITAYNHGLAGMQRARGQCGDVLPEIIECYRGPLFGYASINFYSEFLAALELLNEYRLRQMPSIAVAKTAAPSGTSAVQEYRVRKGDTLGQISKKFATTPKTIMTLNGISNAHRLIAGRVIMVPKG
jgi:membrane-bound lytic murein transglycosylase D